MISKFDMDRRSSGCYNDNDSIKKIQLRINQINNHNKTLNIKILKSKKFSKFMSNVLKYYSEGRLSIRIPLFTSFRFIKLVMEKFDSFDFENKLFYDHKFRLLYFIRVY